MSITSDRLADTLAGGDWPKIDYAPPRYETIPEVGERNHELEQYALDLLGEAGLVLDPWEEDVFLNSLRTRPDGRWGALEVGIMVSRQNGKGPCSIREEILTTDGWTTMGEIRVGQHVYGSAGDPTRVVAKSEVFLGERCYEVKFADGSRHVVGEEHVWPVWDTGGHDAKAYALATGTYEEKRQASRTGGVRKDLATREMAASRWSHHRFDEKYLREKRSFRYRVQCDTVLQTPEADLPIDPYAFGLWLGDGSKSSGKLTVGDDDRAYMREALASGGLEVYAEGQGNDRWQPWHLSFRIPGTRWKHNGFIGQLRRLGVFRNKHIPDCYLTASPAQRLALLQGLMDTDGSIGGRNKSPQVEFSTSIPALAEGFHQLARSLGVRVTPKWRETSRKPNCRFLWTPTFNPFRLPRKAEKYQPPSRSYRRSDRMAITGICEVSSVPVQCIQVEAEDGVYLIGRTFTPTHNSILEARELLALFVDEERFPDVGANLTVHTAHEAKTAHEAFERLSLLIENSKRLKHKVRAHGIRRSEGGESIRLLNGRRIRFRTRTSGGGRGLSGDLLLFDEAMILLRAVHEAVWPIVTARRNPQIWYTGSAVDQRQPLMDQHGLVFSRVRKRGIEGDADLYYVEWSLPYENPDEVTPEEARDPESWLKTNPGLDVRLSRRVIAVEQRSLSPRGFARERLGVGDWPDPDAGNQVINEAAWAAACVDATSQIVGTVCFSVDVAPDRQRSAIGVAGRNASGKNQIEIIRRFRGTGKVLPTLIELVNQHGRRSEIIVEGVGAAGSLIPGMEAAKLKVVPMTRGEHARGCGMVYDGIMGDPEAGVEPSLNHLGDPSLNAAVVGAVKSPLGDRWCWSRKDSSIDISPLVAVTLALYGFLRKRQEGAGVFSAEEILSDEDEDFSAFDDDDLPPLDLEDLE